MWYMVWVGNLNKGLSKFRDKYGKPCVIICKEKPQSPPSEVKFEIDKKLFENEYWITGEFENERLRSGS
jgi:hypothetical protein